MPRASSIASPARAFTSGNSSAPKGRNTSAQGNALGLTTPQNQSPEGAELQNSWKETTLDDACIKISDGTHHSPKEQYNEPAEGLFKYVTAKNIRMAGLDLRNLTYVTEKAHREIFNRCNPEYGDVLLTKDGVNAGDVAINTLDEEFSLLSSVALLKPKRELLDPKFLRYYIESPQGTKRLLGEMRGAAIRRIILRSIKAASIPLPPLPEQRRIVARIEELFSRLAAGVAALRHAKAQLQRYRQSVLAAAVTGQLTESDTTLWSKETISDACETVTDGDHQAPPKVPSGIPFLTIGNISSGRLDFSKTRFVPQEYFEQIKPHRIPASNDVLYSVVGATIGIPVLVSTDRSFCFQRHIALLRPSDRIIPRFLHLFMASPQTFRSAWAGTTGSAQPTLPLKALREIPILLPPLAEQNQIVAEVESRTTAIAHLEAELDRQITRANRLRQSALSTAFSGKLNTHNRS